MGGPLGGLSLGGFKGGFGCCDSSAGISIDKGVFATLIEDLQVIYIHTYIIHLFTQVGI